jgi:hypothetical protein
MSETSTTQRYLCMLSHIPCLPRKITARELAAKLKAGGFDIHTRSIERDLHKLSGGQFALVSDEARPAGWSWRNRDTRFTIPPMDIGGALTWELVSRYLKPILPHGMGQYPGSPVCGSAAHTEPAWRISTRQVACAHCRLAARPSTFAAEDSCCNQRGCLRCRVEWVALRG